MNNKVTVFEFVTEFNNFYNNVLELVEEGYANEKMPRHYVDNVYDRIDGLKTEIERTLDSYTGRYRKSTSYERRKKKTQLNKE